MADLVPFFIIAPPRSGTSFLAAVLSCHDRVCYHDLSLWQGPEEWGRVFRFQGQFLKHIGVSDTGNALRVPFLRETWPEAKFVVVHRPRGLVEASLERVSDKDFPLNEIYLGLEDAASDPLSHWVTSPFSVPALAGIWDWLFPDEPIPYQYLTQMLHLQVEPRYLKDAALVPALSRF